jgi:hypothetical protein
VRARALLAAAVHRCRVRDGAVKTINGLIRLLHTDSQRQRGRAVHTSVDLRLLRVGACLITACGRRRRGCEECAQGGSMRLLGCRLRVHGSHGDAQRVRCSGVRLLCLLRRLHARRRLRAGLIVLARYCCVWDTWNSRL